MAVEFRTPENIDATPPLSGNAFGPVVGGDTAIVTSDGDASYVEVAEYSIDNVGLVRTGHTFTWTPAGSIPPDAVVTIEADWRLSGDHPNGFFISFVHPTLGGRSLGSIAPGSGEFTHAYGDLSTLTVPPTWVEDGEAFGPGVVWSVESLSAPGGSIPSSSRITRLTMRIETVGGPEPLRLRQRSDGLGLGSNRVRGVGSRQGSVRVRGYL